MKLHFNKTGEGKPFIILHGLFGSGDNWMSFARASAEKGFAVYQVDLRNHGRSPHATAHSLKLMSDDVFEYFEAIVDMDDDKIEALEIYRDNILGKHYEISVSDLIEQFEESYQGYYGGKSDTAEVEYAYEYVEQAGILNNCPNELSRYFDYEAYARDLFSGSFVEHDGYVFTN